MITNRRDYIKDKLFLTEAELDEVLVDKDSESLFAIYMTALNFNDYGFSVFTDHNFNMHTKLFNRREVDGCYCLYDVLLRKPFLLRKDGDLFRFIKGAIISSRGLREGELL